MKLNDEILKGGDRVKLVDSDISGVIVWIDLNKSSYASVLDDDADMWMEEGDDGTCEFLVSELQKEVN